jgi:hypothetical protein
MKRKVEISMNDQIITDGVVLDKPADTVSIVLSGVRWDQVVIRKVGGKSPDEAHVVLQINAVDAVSAGYDNLYMR